MIKFLNDRDRDKVNFSTMGHTHKNYEELNKIEELNGKITYDGKDLRMVEDGRVISKVIEESGFLYIYLDGSNPDEGFMNPTDVISIPLTFVDKNSHKHENKDVLDKFTATSGTNGERLIFDSVWIRSVDDGAVIESVSQDEDTGDITIAYKSLPVKVVPADTVTIEGHKALWAAIEAVEAKIPPVAEEVEY